MNTQPMPPRRLGAAWLNTSLASGEDVSRPMLYRTVCVELFKHGIQLIATDSSMLFGSFVPNYIDDLTPAPSIDEAPIETYVATDPDLQGRKLMKYAYDEAKIAEKAQWPPDDVFLSIKSGETRERPALDPTLDSRKLVIRCKDTTVALPIYDGDYPNWRTLISRPKPKATKTIGVDAALLGRFGKLKDFYHPLVMDFAGDANMITLSAPGDESYFFGGLMPIKLDGGNR